MSEMDTWPEVKKIVIKSILFVTLLHAIFEKNVPSSLKVEAFM